MDEENIIRNIVKEISKDFKKDRIDLDLNFCAFYVNLLALDPNWCTFEDILRSRMQVQKLIRHVVSKLKQSEDPQIQILKVQFYFDYEFERLEEMPAIHRQELTDKLDPLKQVLLEPPCTSNYTIDQIYQKVITYITILHGLGNPMTKQVYREADTALKSFWGESEIIGFMNNLYVTRSDLLEKVGMLTTGIRLFNMDCGRGGYGIYDLPDQLGLAVEAVKEYISIMQEETSQRVTWLTDVVRRCYKLNNQKYILSFQIVIPADAKESDLEYLKDLLVIYKQHAEDLGKLEKQLDVLETDIDKLRESYLKTLMFLHDRIVPNMHIRATIVFPVFEKLSDLWSQFQDQTVKLKGLADILNKQDRLVKSLDFENPLLCLWMEPYTIPSDIYSRDFKLPISKDANVFRRENLDYFNKVTFEFGGHCCWYLVMTQGVLAMGDDSNGIVKYKGCFYIFSSPLGTKSFARKPEYYLMLLLDLARRKCELINYLGIQNRMAAYRDVKEICEVEQEDIELADADTSTLACMIPEKYIDSTYTWNIWELKRQALRLADCLHVVTRSSETNKSSNVNMGIQLWPPKDAQVQTQSDNYANTERHLQFLFGLRGRKDDKQLQLDLNGGEIRPRNGNK